MAVEDFLLKKARVSTKVHKRILLDDKMTFFQQLGSLVSSGVPLVQALQIGAEQSQSERLQDVLREVAARVSAGCTLNAALSNHRNIFEDHWIALIGTGEVSGKMDQVLEDLNAQIYEAQETKRKGPVPAGCLP